MSIERSTASGVRLTPRSTSPIISEKSAETVAESPASPAMVISFPRTEMFGSNWSSMSLRSESPWPSRRVMSSSGGTTRRI